MNAEVRENPEQHRFEWLIHNNTMAAAHYTVAEGKLVFVHMEVPQAHSGLGIATALARGTLELLRKSGRRAILKCTFLKHFISTHPEYADVVEA